MAQGYHRAAPGSTSIGASDPDHGKAVRERWAYEQTTAPSSMAHMSNGEEQAMAPSHPHDGAPPHLGMAGIQACWSHSSVRVITQTSPPGQNEQSGTQSQCSTGKHCPV